MPEIKDIVWGRVRKILKKVREEDNGDFWTDRILLMKEIAEGLELLERGYNAKVDREAELPSPAKPIKINLITTSYDAGYWQCRQDMAGWVKEEE